MIFTKKNYKISSGKNPSIYSKSANELVFYIFDNSVNKFDIIIDNTLRCIPTKTTFPYNHVCKLSQNFLCVCFDDNISVINDEN